MNDTTQNTAAAKRDMHESASLDAPVDFIFDRYVLAIVGKEHKNYNAIELYGVRSYAIGQDDATIYEIDNQTPTSFSVYVRNVGGGIECVGDFSRFSDAERYAVELNQQFGWPISNFISEDASKTNCAILQ